MIEQAHETTAYICGPMRGIPEFNFPAFFEAAKALRAHNVRVISPAEHDLSMGFVWEGTTGNEPVENGHFQAMQQWDVAQVMALRPGVDFLYVLPGWENSKGALAETALANWRGVEIIMAGVVKNPAAEQASEAMDTMTQTQQFGDPRFHAILKEIGDLHDKKAADYGSDADPYANVRASAEFGVPPWVGALVRENDKSTRLKQLAKRGWLANESAEDSMLDKAVYSIIALILYREESQKATGVQKQMAASFTGAPRC